MWADQVARNGDGATFHAREVHCGGTMKVHRHVLVVGQMIPLGVAVRCGCRSTPWVDALDWGLPCCRCQVAAEDVGPQHQPYREVPPHMIQDTLGFQC